MGNKIAKGYAVALELKYRAEIAEAKAVLETYFKRTVGIGEHSDLLTEFDTWIEKLANAEDKLESLKTNFSDYF